jgi:hypothetical protein
MGHIQELEREFRALLAKDDKENIVKFVKEKVFESYRNGLRDAGKSKEPSKQTRKNWKS